MSEITLTSDQKNAYDAFFRFLADDSEKVFVLSGYSGTGKSTLVRKILADMPNRLKTLKLIKPEMKELELKLTATTNKAAQNLANITNEPCGTIHSLLGLRVHTDYKTQTTSLVRCKKAKDVRDNLIFVDEASYIDDELLQKILNFTLGCKIVFIGDPAQLLSVGTSKSFVFDAGWPQATLTQIVRQADDNPIQELSNKFRELVNTGEFFSFKPDDKAIRHLPDKKDFEKEVMSEFTRQDWKHDDSKVLAFTNRKVIGFNQNIRKQAQGTPQLEVGDYAVVNRFVTPVIGKYLKTDQQVEITKKFPCTRHGVTGYSFELDNKVTGFMPTSWVTANKVKAKAIEEDRLNVVMDIDEWLDLRAAYSCTINKSQGSTYDKVFIDLDDLKKCRDPNQLARMLYVGVSRARNNVILTGDLI